MHVAFTEMKSVFGALVFVIVLCVEAHRYNTIHEPSNKRVTAHVPYVVRKSCLLRPEPGPCRSNLGMYYYDPEIGNCTTFSWGGCQGNGNRFDTQKDCLSTCLSSADDKPSRPKYCFLTFDYGFCFGASYRYYYDHMWKVCKETIYSGCGGNKNNFYSMEQCESICRLGRGIVNTPATSDTGLKKALIINPPDANPARGKDQIQVTDPIQVTDQMQVKVR